MKIRFLNKSMEKKTMNRSFWLLVGSQTLYGDEVLRTVDARAKEMVQYLNESGKLPYTVIYKGTAKSNDERAHFVIEASKPGTLYFDELSLTAL